MKHITKIASALAISLTFASCANQLENPRKGANDFNTFYANASAEDAEKLIAEAYRQYFNGPEEVQKQNFFEIISDDAGCGGGSYADNANRYRNADELTCQASDWLFHGPGRGYSLYQSLYMVIYHCNLILDKIPETSDARINRVKAEAKFLRAVNLFEAMRIWHNPPFADHIYTAEDMLAPNGDPKEMIDWILSNLDEASKELPAIDTKGAQAKIGGRASAAAAQAFYGKAALWYGTQYNDKSYVEKAIAPLKSIMTSNKYGLISDPRDLFHQSADWCEEYIFERCCAETSSDKTLQNDNRQTWRSLRADNIWVPKEIRDYGWGFCNPSQEFIDFMKEHDGADSPRFQSKLISYEQLLDMTYPNETEKGMKAGKTYPNVYGYWNATCLMWEEDLYTDTGVNFYSRANNPIIRYAEVLLMYAEAQFIANGDTDKSGLAALNQVRERAGLKDIATLDMQAIIDERRAELFSECERWFDIIRWRIADKVLANAGKERTEFGGLNPDGTYNLIVTPGEGKGWDDKYWELPFGDNQLQANPNLVQHKGW